MRDFNDLIFSNQVSFQEKADQIFRFQYKNNSVYREFCDALGFAEDDATQTGDLPLLPIRAFRDHQLICGDSTPKMLFMSSGTTGSQRSSHFIIDPELYRKSVLEGFYRFFPAERFSTLFLLPGYSENVNSSLIQMANYLIEEDPDHTSSFITSDEKERTETLLREILNQDKIPLLFAAAFGLLELLEGDFPSIPESAHIIETGGMKTYRREMSRTELRKSLSDGFGIQQDQIHSEYGMCELMSQMYAISGEWFEVPPWVQVSIRDAENPFRICDTGEEGKIGIIDLANCYSCSFLLTEDRGVMNERGEFQVLGRWSGAELRGCNFLFEE